VLAGEKAGQQAARAFVSSSDEAVEGPMLPGHSAVGVLSATRALTSVDEPATLLVGQTFPGQTFLLGHRPYLPAGKLRKARGYSIRPLRK
jgi:hypothetical protein